MIRASGSWMDRRSRPTPRSSRTRVRRRRSIGSSGRSRPRMSMFREISPRTSVRRGKDPCDGEWKLSCAIHNLHNLRGHEERLKKDHLTGRVRSAPQNEVFGERGGRVCLRRGPKTGILRLDRSEIVHYVFHKFGGYAAASIAKKDRNLQSKSGIGGRN